jgi:hypothetical protein
LRQFKVGEKVFIPAIVTREADSEGDVRVHLLSNSSPGVQYVKASMLVAEPPASKIVQPVDGLTAALRAHRERMSKEEERN